VLGFTPTLGQSGVATGCISLFIDENKFKSHPTNMMKFLIVGT
jgi:hypothetical protein